MRIFIIFIKLFAQFMIETHPSAGVVDMHCHNTKNAILRKELPLNQLNHTFAHKLQSTEEIFNFFQGLLFTEALTHLLQTPLHLLFYLCAEPLQLKIIEVFVFVFVCVRNNVKLLLVWRKRYPSDIVARAEHWMEEK
ncbi:uncharacterized protein MONOS_13391 [Monocercomonoides exilis]|uniref:uncharacterized protein n=1 Tax=Monocercomonoides exilis TaxID=2049356 RepID=UPI0035595F87|nr:hypothetical protein MONOS_13391 [Monocercomonoides exilis]|eukprot:MONOS_13391.1-p1 / transcript=MONOS_13391.1 / gene=MONOS_13391 / organism=Monocercomonoides_exilis_PA203 / gene_product=unspecified product / transcript_product=unspecified product / location=Mono_scaffold00820:24472-24882(+) / protein_length=137 / sequence_SO=supercontig / SO=protein_coding / is_pseudo=false